MRRCSVWIKTVFLLFVFGSRSAALVPPSQQGQSFSSSVSAPKLQHSQPGSSALKSLAAAGESDGLAKRGPSQQGQSFSSSVSAPQLQHSQPGSSALKSSAAVGESDGLAKRGQPRASFVTARRLRDRIMSMAPPGLRGPPTIDTVVFATYFCAAFAVTLPVNLVPVIASELAARPSAQVAVASFVATTASVSTLCGGVGKLVNGFVCQGLGGRAASSAYLAGMAASLLALSRTASPGGFGPVLGGLEFFSSMQWTACSLVLAGRHRGDPKGFASGIAGLTLASTAGTLAAKAGGTALLGALGDWRAAARVGACVALAGSVAVGTLVRDTEGRKVVGGDGKGPVADSGLSLSAARSSMGRVLGSPLFWLVGLAHSTALMTRSADRVLASFVLEATDLPRKYCGGLTASMTLGFLGGLRNTRAFHERPDVRTKRRFLGGLYAGASLSAVGLILCAATTLMASSPVPPSIMAAIIASCAGSMTYHLSFQAYQIPAMVSSTLFRADGAVALSLLDAFGFFLASPVWAATSRMTAAMGERGWIAAWTLLATLFAAGGSIMVSVLPAVLAKQSKSIKGESKF